MMTRVLPPLTAADAAVAGFDERSTRIGANVLLPAVLRDLGHDPAPLFAAAGMDLSLFNDPEATASMRDLGRLMQLAIAASGRRDLGLLIAERAGIAYTGVLLHRLASEQDLRGALNALVRLVALNTRSAAMRLVVDDTQATLEIGSNHPLSDVSASYDEAIVAITFFALRALLGGDWRPMAINIAHTPTAPTAVYRRIFETSLRFDRPRSAIIFPVKDLGRKLPGHDRDRLLELELAIRIAAGHLGLNVEDHARAAIRAHLAQPYLSRGRVAGMLGLSTRTLNRRLGERGLTFADLMRESRFAAAKELLLQSDARLGEIATAVGYGDQSAFSRAFRSWTGQAPQSWRARQPARSG